MITCSCLKPRVSRKRSHALAHFDIEKEKKEVHYTGRKKYRYASYYCSKRKGFDVDFFVCHIPFYVHIGDLYHNTLKHADIEHITASTTCI